MKKLFLILGASLFIASCVPTVMPLYNWGNYEVTSYAYLKKNDEKSIKALLETYQKLIEKQDGVRKVIPPGIYADYGFLLIQTGKNQEGKAMLEKEIALYPESKFFIERILKLMEK